METQTFVENATCRVSLLRDYANFNSLFQMADNAMGGIEAIAKISDKNTFRQKLERFNTKYLVPFLTVAPETDANALILKRKYKNVLIDQVFEA